MIETIMSVGKRELMREARIAMRIIDAVWRGLKVEDDDLKRMTDAAERIVSLRRTFEREHGETISRQKIKRDEIGLTRLAMLLNVGAANLGKMLEGNRRLGSLRCKTIRLQ
jgi:hypothetical protein